jgi:hypothetical protein
VLSVWVIPVRLHSIMSITYDERLLGSPISMGIQASGK